MIWVFDENQIKKKYYLEVIIECRMTNNAAKEEDLFLKRMTRWNSYQREDENWKWKGRPNHRNLTVKAALNNDKLKQKVSNDTISMKEVERNLEILSNYIRDNPDPEDSDNESSVKSNTSNDGIKCNVSEAMNKIKVPISKAKKHDKIKLNDCLKIKKDLRKKISMKKDEKLISIDMNALDLLEVVNTNDNNNSILPNNINDGNVVMSPKSRNSQVIVDSVQSSNSNKPLSMIEKVKQHNTLRLKSIQPQHAEQTMLPNINSTDLKDLNVNTRSFLTPSPIIFNTKTNDNTDNTERTDNTYNADNNECPQVQKIDKNRFEYLKKKYLNDDTENINDDGLLKSKKKSTKRKKEKSLKKIMVHARDDSNLGYPYNFYSNNFEIDHMASMQSDDRKFYAPLNKVEAPARPVSSPSLPYIKKKTNGNFDTSVKSVLVNKSKIIKKSSTMSNNQNRSKIVIGKSNNVATINAADDNLSSNVSPAKDHLDQNIQILSKMDPMASNSFDVTESLPNDFNNNNSFSPGGSSIFYISDSDDDMSTVIDVGSFSNGNNLNYKSEDMNNIDVQQNNIAIKTNNSDDVLTVDTTILSTSIAVFDSNLAGNIVDVRSPDIKNIIADSNLAGNNIYHANSATVVDLADYSLRENEKIILSSSPELKFVPSEIGPLLTLECIKSVSPNSLCVTNDYSNEINAQLLPLNLQSNQSCNDHNYRKHMTSTIIPNQNTGVKLCSSNNKSSFITPSSTRFFDVSSTSDKGRFRVNDAREFDTDSLFRRPDILNNYVTVLFGKKRSNGETKVISLLFDRDEFKTELDAYNWWLNNKDRFNV